MTDPDGKFVWFVASFLCGLTVFANTPETEDDIYTGPTEAAILLPLPKIGPAVEFFGSVSRGPTLKLTGKLKNAPQIRINNATGKVAESYVSKSLTKKYGKGNVYSHITAKFKDGKKVVFDNVVHKDGKLLINETKANGAKLSKNQQRFFKGGESVTFVGEKAEEAKVFGRTINANTVETSITRVKVKIKE